MPTNVLVLNKSWLITGAGAPEGSLAGPLGSIFLREDGQAGQTLYVKEAGAAGNTGWRAFATADSVTLPANVAYKDQDNQFVAQTFAPGSVVLGASAALYFKDTAGAANNQFSHIQAVGGSLVFRLLNDALGTQSSPIVLNRDSSVTATTKEFRVEGNANFVRLHLRDLMGTVGSQTFVFLNYTGLLYICPTTDDGMLYAGAGWDAGLTLDRAGNLEVKGRLMLGGTTVGFPSFRVGAAVPQGLPSMEVVTGDNTNWAGVRAACFISTSTYNSLGDLTVTGATNFTAGVTITAGNLVCAGNLNGAGACQMEGPVYPGRIDVTGSARAQGSWYFAGHSSYGLYSNTGLYLAANLWVAGTTTLATTYWGAGHYAQNNVLYKPRLQAYSENWAAANVPGNNYAYLNVDSANHYFAHWYSSLTFVFQNPPPSQQVGMVVLALFAHGANYGLGWYGGEGYGNGVRWPNGTAPVPTITEGKVDFYTFYTYDGGANWWGFVSGQNM